MTIIFCKYLIGVFIERSLPWKALPIYWIFKKELELFPKESKDKQIYQNTQNYLAKCNADCRGNILKNIMIFSKKLEKRKVF